MNTIQCPVCKQMLEGEFEMTDELKCPSCGTSFVPERLVAFSKKSSKTALPTAFAPKRYEPAQRPTEIVWVVAILVGGYALILGVAFLRVVIGAMSGQWNMADNAFRPIIGRFPQYFLTVFFSWKLFRGKAWARNLLNWLLPIELVVGGILVVGSTSDSLIQASLDGATISDFTLRVLPILSLFIVIGMFGTPLYFINRKVVRAWFATATEQTASSKPRWWIWAVGYYFSLLIISFLMTIVAISNRDLVQPVDIDKPHSESRESQNSVFPHSQRSQSGNNPVKQTALPPILPRETELQNDMQSQYEQGLRYEKEKQFEQAARWFQLAANTGHRDAQYKLGLYYSWGAGVVPSDTVAAKWMLKSAQQGNVEAQVQMGRWYSLGTGVEKMTEKHSNGLKKPLTKAVRKDRFSSAYVS